MAIAEASTQRRRSPDLPETMRAAVFRGPGDRVLVGAITPCGSCFYCQNHTEAQCSGHEDQWEMIGGWRLGNSIDGVQAEYFRVPYAQANLAKIPDDLTDEQCVLLAVKVAIRP